MASSLSNFVNNLAEGIHKIKWEYGHNDKRHYTCRHKYKDWECCLEFINVEDDLIKYKCLCCKKNYQKKFDENIKKRFVKTCNFSNHDISKFMLLLRKGVYPYE